MILKSWTRENFLQIINGGEIFVGGLKVKAISGLDSSKLRIKKKTFN